MKNFTVQNFFLTFFAKKSIVSTNKKINARGALAETELSGVLTRSCVSMPVLTLTT